MIFAIKNGRLQVKALFQIAFEHFSTPTGQNICPLFLTDINVIEDSLQLPLRNLRAHLRDAVQRITAADRFHPTNSPFHKAFINGFLHQRAAWTGANLALVEGKQRKPFQRFVEESVLFIHNIGKENVRRFTAQLQRDRNDILSRILHDLLAHFRGAGKRDFRDTLRRRQIFTDFAARPVHNVNHTRRNQVADDFHQQQYGQRR
ncbi:hypothetical protein D3C78_717930 [compost metagenome]